LSGKSGLGAIGDRCVEIQDFKDLHEGSETFLSLTTRETLPKYQKHEVVLTPEKGTPYTA